VPWSICGEKEGKSKSDGTEVEGDFWGLHSLLLSSGLSPQTRNSLTSNTALKPGILSPQIQPSSQEF